MNEMIITHASADDLSLIRAMLMDAGLPIDDIADIEAHSGQFLTARLGDEITGCVAMEYFGETGLFRSFAVKPEYRGHGIGLSLYESMVNTASLHGVRDVYLLTTTARDWFAARGFTPVSREELPAAIQGTKEFSSLCPVTAVCMHLPLY